MYEKIEQHRVVVKDVIALLRETSHAAHILGLATLSQELRVLASALDESCATLPKCE